MATESEYQDVKVCLPSIASKSKHFNFLRNSPESLSSNLINHSPERVANSKPADILIQNQKEKSKNLFAMKDLNWQRKNSNQFIGVNGVRKIPKYQRNTANYRSQSDLSKTDLGDSQTTFLVPK